MKNLVNRFIEYVKYDSTSDYECLTFPSTEKQKNLAKKIVEDLKSMGLTDAHTNDDCYVYASLPANTDKKIPKIGFIAHMDTTPEMSGTNVNPQIVENYQGTIITLNKDKNIVLDPNEFPSLKNYIGQTLITTDGTTLLGADDKAGIVEIIEAIDYLIKHPEIKHGDIKIGFTPDEEVGQGADRFDVKGFDADFAYTVDGGPVGELEYENFNAASVKLNIKGKSVHPGSAKNQLINAGSIAIDFHNMLPQEQMPEFTDRYEGFYLLNSINSGIEDAVVEYALRDFCADGLEKRKQTIIAIADFINKRYDREIITVEIKDSYKNMKEQILPVMHIVETAAKAMENVGVTPIIIPIRGGTDGARLSYMGLPTPNMFTGGENFHGKYEYVSLQSMEKATETILEIIKLYAK